MADALDTFQHDAFQLSAFQASSRPMHFVDETVVAAHATADGTTAATFGDEATQ